MLQTWQRTRIGLRDLSETDLEFRDAPDFSRVKVAVDLSNKKLELGLTMPQTVNATIHHQWSDDLALPGSYV